MCNRLRNSLQKSQQETLSASYLLVGVLRLLLRPTGSLTKRVFKMGRELGDVMGVYASKRIRFGWGINNADYVTAKHENYIDESGKKRKRSTELCPFSSRWHEVVKRGYSESFKVKYPTYADCWVNDEWKYFLDFKDWMSSKYWQGLQLDKDILVPGNKEYSSITCEFVPSSINKLLLDTAKMRGDWPLGVSKYKGYSTKGHYQANARIFSEGGSGVIGKFFTPEDAHRAWQETKIISIEKAMSWYSKQDFYLENIEEAFIKRVQVLKSDISENKITVKL